MCNSELDNENIRRYSITRTVSLVTAKKVELLRRYGQLENRHPDSCNY